MSGLSIFITSNFYRILVSTSVFSIMVYTIYLISDKKVWRTEYTDPDDDIVHRVQARGLFASLITSFICLIITVIMSYIGVSQNGIEIFFGFIFTPVLGYMMDISIGTDEGFMLFKTQFVQWIKYTFSRLATASFTRYIVSILLDMYISKPFAAVLRGFTIFNLEKLQSYGLIKKLDLFIIRNITSIVQSLVSIITFQTYTNQTRFLWAYPSKRLQKSSRINSSTILLTTSLSSVFYLSQYAKEVTSLSLHIFISILSFFLLSGLFLFRSLDEEYIPIEKDIESDESSETNKFYIGIMIFLFFCIIGIWFPIFNRPRNRPTKTSDIQTSIRDYVTDPITRKVIALMDQEFKNTGQI